MSAENTNAGGGEPRPLAIEAMADHLLEEEGYDYTWPTHAADEGYRGGGSYVRLPPPDIQAELREKARRILIRADQIARDPKLAALTAQSTGNGGVAAEPVAWLWELIDSQGWPRRHVALGRPTLTHYVRNVEPLFKHPPVAADPAAGILRVALAPFAAAWQSCQDLGDQGAGYVQDDQDAWVSGNRNGGAHPLFKFGDLRRAAEALAAAPTPPAGGGHDAERFRALMRCGRIKMQGSAGVDPKTGERTYAAIPGRVHFGAEFWPDCDADPDVGTVWGRHCLRALADDILALEASSPDQNRGEPDQGGKVEPCWPNGCIKPNACARHGGCMYAMGESQCRHYGKDLTADVEAARSDQGGANTEAGR